jgi:hypothetical protein
MSGKNALTEAEIAETTAGGKPRTPAAWACRIPATEWLDKVFVRDGRLDRRRLRQELRPVHRRRRDLSCSGRHPDGLRKDGYII